MPGLFGILPKRPNFSAGSLLATGKRMADSMRHEPWQRVEIWGNEDFCAGRVHLGIHNPDPQPMSTENGSTLAWFDGEYFPPSNPLSSATPSGDEIHRMLKDSEALALTDGAFNVARYDIENRELVLANDRLGLRPLYRAETRDWFAYAGEVKALLVIHDKLPDLDEISLRQFFGFDHMLGERTWWKGIEALPPATVLHVSARDRGRHRYWSFDDIRNEPRKTADVENEMDLLWTLDVKRHSRPGTMPLLLSGGLDSRLLVATLLAQGNDLVAITCGSESSPDINIARRVAKVARIPHRTIYLGPHNWWHRREEAIWQTDGLVNGLNFHVALAIEEMRTGNSYSPVNIAGDLLFGGSHLRRHLIANRPHSVADMLADRYVQNPFFGRREILDASVGDAQPYLAGPSSDCFHLAQRMRRFTLHGSGQLASHCEMAFPGLSRGLLQLMLGSLSEADRIGHKFYNRWLATRYPRYFANLPWQGTGRGLAESHITRLYRGLGYRTKRFLRIKKYRIAPLQWFVDYGACIRESSVGEQLLQDGLAVDEYLGGAARRAIQNGAASQLSPQTLLGILTFETYLRKVAGMSKVAGPITLASV
jgi:hypothetical protein